MKKKNQVSLFLTVSCVTAISKDYDGELAFSVQISLKCHQSQHTLNHILPVSQTALITLTLKSHSSLACLEAVAHICECEAPISDPHTQKPLTGKLLSLSILHCYKPSFQKNQRKQLIFPLIGTKHNPPNPC